MHLLRRSIKWVMGIAGLLTCTMFHAAVAPQAELHSNFGQGMEVGVSVVVDTVIVVLFATDLVAERRSPPSAS